MKPNLIIPLAHSYDQRFPEAKVSDVAYDQRKVNAWYEVIQNPLTGKATLMLAKRPGVSTGTTIDDYGTSTQVPYLCPKRHSAGAMPILIVKDGNDINCIYPTGIGTTASETILSDEDYAPNYIATTDISGTTNLVLQCRGNTGSDGATDNGDQRAFYSPDWGANWTEITDGVWSSTATYKAGKMVHMDGFSFVLGQAGVYGSDLNNLASWPASNFIGKSVEQDYSLGLIPYNDRILAFGERTCEHFYNAGNAAGSPLSRVQGRVDRIGLASFLHYGNNRTEYYCYVGNILFFLGKDTASYHQTSLFAFNGERFERVSTMHQERLFANVGAYAVFPVTWQSRPAVAILLTEPGAEKARWLMFFPEWKSWFEWESTVFSPINSGTYHAGVSSPNKLYNHVFNKWTDDGTNYEFLTQFRLPFDDDERKFMRACGVQADTVSDATMDIAFNDAGAGTYTAFRTISLANIKKEAVRCGSFRERYVQLSNTSDKQLRLRNFYATME